MSDVTPTIVSLTAEQDAELRDIDGQAVRILAEMGQLAFQRTQLETQLAASAQQLQQLATAKQKRLVDFATWHRIETDPQKTPMRWTLDDKTTPMTFRQMS